jgi:Zn-dependent protease
MNASFLFSSLIQVLLLWLAVTLHESAHAWAASLCGDRTARDLGRASLNPLRHVNLLGSVLFPCLLLAAGWPAFGWGRSTPVLRERLRRPVWDDLLVLAAGPAANFAVAVVATAATVVVMRELGPEARKATFGALFSLSFGESLPSYPVMFTLVRLASINALMAVFNLIPLPPLDGGQIALYLLPPHWADQLAAFRPYGLMIGVLAAVVLVPVLTILLGLVINFS